MFKKKDKRDFDTLVSDTIYQIAIDALQQIISTEIIGEDEGLDLEMTIMVMKQKAQTALNFVESLSESAAEEEPKQKVKEKRGYGRK